MTDENGQIRQDTITFQEATTKSQSALDALFEAWTQLRCIVAQHESALSRRWSRKTNKQRKELLSQAWPEMPPMHRPDFEVLRNKDWGKRSTARTDFALRFPHLNLEDLSQKDYLLLMLDSRSKNSPATFTNADRDSLRVGIRSRLIDPRYLPGYTMYLNRQHTRATYGRLVSWADDRQAFLRLHESIDPDPGIGLLILEIQRDVLQFLVRCAGLILHDTPMANLLNTSTAATPAFQMLSSTQVKTSSTTSTTDQESLTAHALEGPYRAPDVFDFERLKCLLDAKCGEVEDHFFLVREDPGYFAELLHEACNHTSEAVLNRHYDPHSTYLSETSWDEALGEVLLTAYHDMFTCELMSRLLDQLMKSYTEHKASIDLGQTFPKAYIEAFSRLWVCLDCTVDSYLNALPNYVSAVPTFKSHVFNEMHLDGGYRCQLANKPDEHLFWLFKKLGMERQGEEQIYGLPNLLQELENLIAHDQKQKTRLSWNLIRLVSEVAVIAELQRQMVMSTCNGSAILALPEEEISAWILTLMPSLRQIREVLNQRTGLASLVMDLRKFDHPSHKHCTASSTAKLRSAENALDNLWEKLTQLSVRKTGKTLKALEGNRVNYRDLRRTPAWTEPKPFTEFNSQVSEDLDVALALATLEQRTECTIDQSQPSAARQKMKTRNSAAFHIPADTPEADRDTIGGTTDAEYTENSKLIVKKKAFNTFAALFGKPIADTLPDELPWNDFKKAMVSIGFGTEKLQGSAWLFKSTEKSAFSSIIFHEPHPDSKLPMQWARRIARRLNRNFGWTADTFVTE
ncbi:MAG: hypothetical protein Q9221_004256 [Calogaya cf. arnoldii]